MPESNNLIKQLGAERINEHSISLFEFFAVTDTDAILLQVHVRVHEHART